jgi:hypothetical protein
MRLPLILCLYAVSACLPAAAGAWTQVKGQTLLIDGITVSEASDQFGPTATPKGFYFNKTFIQSSLEYGVTNWLTLLAAPEFVSARWGASQQAAVKAPDTAVDAGLRLRLFAGAGVLSIQGTACSAGAFDLYVADPTSNGSAKLISGKAAEARLLYGRNFKLFGRDGFSDVEAAERWISRPRPNELAVDTATGLWLTKKTLVLLQTFNTLSQGRTSQPYRASKLEVSLVQNLVKEWSLQMGGFVSPSGSNTIVERGITLSIWRRY